jgi:hypothetical protein
MDATATTHRPTPKYLSVDDWLKQNPGVIGRTLAFEAIRRGELPHIRLGRRILVPVDAFDVLLERQMARRATEAA